MPDQHLFASTRDAYTSVNTGVNIDTGDRVRDGDILIVPSEGVIGFAYSAWPTAVVYPTDEPGAFHTMADTFESNNPQYAESIRICRQIAVEDADITGNDHWRNAAS